MRIVFLSKLVGSLFVAVAALLGFTTLKSCQQITALGKAGDWVNQSHALFSELRDIGSVYRSLGAIHLAQHTTGDRALVATFQNRQQDLIEHLEIARSLASVDSESARLFEQLEQLVRDHLEQLKSKLRPTTDDGKRFVNTPFSGTLDNAGIEAALRELLRYQTTLLTEHDRAVFEEKMRTETALVTSTSLGFALLLLTTIVLARDIKRQRKLEAKLREMNAELEATVSARTQKLTESNAELRQSSLELRWKNQSLAHQLRYNLPIIDRVSDAVVIVTQTMRISRVNPAAKALFAAEPNELFNRSIFDLLEPVSVDGSTNLKSLLEASLLEGREFTHPTLARLHLPLFKSFVDLSIVPVRDNDRIVGALLFLKSL